jgi:hypothetical protein
LGSLQIPLLFAERIILFDFADKGPRLIGPRITPLKLQPAAIGLGYRQRSARKHE